VLVSCAIPPVADLTTTLISVQTLEHGSIAFKSSFSTFAEMMAHCAVQKFWMIGTSNAPRSLLSLLLAASVVSLERVEEKEASPSTTFNPEMNVACNNRSATSDAMIFLNIIRFNSSLLYTK